VRYNFAVTSHDPLAQSRGVFTFFFDADQKIWQTLGTQETQRPVCTIVEGKAVDHPRDLTDAEAEICQTGIELDAPLQLAVGPIMKRDSRGRKYTSGSSLLAGRYRLRLLTLARHTNDVQDHAVDVSMATPLGTRLEYRVEPTRGKYLRVVVRGNDVNAWNSINELKCSAMISGTPAVTASGCVESYEPKKAADGDRATRWAIDGKPHWIQFELDPAKPFDRVAIEWYEGKRRTYDFDLQVSADGSEWSELKFKRPVPSPSNPISDRITVTVPSDGPRQVLKRTYDLELEGPGSVQLTLTPVRGKMLLCGLTLESVVSPEPAPGE
jgi:hypothetical protein